MIALNENDCFIEVKLKINILYKINTIINGIIYYDSIELDFEHNNVSINSDNNVTYEYFVDTFKLNKISYNTYNLIANFVKEINNNVMIMYRELFAIYKQLIMKEFPQ